MKAYTVTCTKFKHRGDLIDIYQYPDGRTTVYQNFAIQSGEDKKKILKIAETKDEGGRTNE